MRTNNRRSRMDAGSGFITPCEIFLGALTEGGYGQVSVNGGRQYAHRQAWIDEHGLIPEGLQVDHLCRVRVCRNVSHLELVTPAENRRRGLGNRGPRKKPTIVHRDALKVGSVCRSGRHVVRPLDLAKGQCSLCHNEAAKLSKMRFRTQSRAAQLGDWGEFRRLGVRELVAS